MSTNMSIGFILLAILLATSPACVPESETSPPNPSPSRGKICTLYAHDPLRCVVDLDTGEYGRILDDSDGIQAYGGDLGIRFASGNLALIGGVGGGDRAVLKNMGVLQALGGLSSDFWRLNRDADDIVSPGDAGSARRVAAFGGEASSVEPVAISSGHLYALRIDSGEAKRYFVILATEVVTQSSATVIWRQLR